MTEKKQQKKTEDEKIKDGIVKEVVSINHGKPGDAQIRPNMAIVMIGNDPKSALHVESIEKEGVKVGIDTHSYICPLDSDEEEIKAMIDCLNDDETIDGIYIVLPLPGNFKSEEVLALVKPDKDMNYLVEGEQGEDMKEAKLFKGALEMFKAKEVEEL